MRRIGPALLAVLAAVWVTPTPQAADLRGTGDLGIVIERASGSVQVVDVSSHESLGRIDGLGDLSHASAVFTPDQRYAFIFGRDGGLTKIDLLTRSIVKRVVQAGNSIGGAISDDGRLVAVSNYDPGGVRVFDAATLDPVADIPAAYDGNGTRSKTVGLVDAPGRRFVFTLYDAGEIWLADFGAASELRIERFKEIGALPYDALITGDGRHYIAGLFGEDGLAHIDLWQDPPVVEAHGPSERRDVGPGFGGLAPVAAGLGEQAGLVEQLVALQHLLLVPAAAVQPAADTQTLDAL